MICPRCQTPNRDEDRFCEQCGAPLPAAAQQLPSPDDQLAGPTMLAGPAAPSVLIRLGPDGGTPYPLGSRVVIGRLESCDVPVNDKSVSREHARLSRLRDGYVIEDLGSTNGTLVNGRRINEAVLLRPGDRVTIGSVDFRYDVGSPAGQPEPAFPGADSAMMTPAPSAVPGTEVDHVPAPDKTPTMHEVPPVPMSFPPLEPFAAGPGADTAPEQVEAQRAEPAPAMAPPQTPPLPAAPELQPEARPAAFAPAEPAPAPPGPAPRMEEALPPPVHFAPAPSKETAVSADEATLLASRLSTLLQDLTRERDEERSAVQRLQQRLAELEESERTRRSVKDIVEDAPEPSMPKQQLQSVQDILDSLIQNPRDVGILMQLGEQAPSLAAVVNEYGQVRRTLNRIARELGVSLPP